MSAEKKIPKKLKRTLKKLKIPLLGKTYRFDCELSTDYLSGRKRLHAVGAFPSKLLGKIAVDLDTNGLVASMLLTFERIKLDDLDACDDVNQINYYNRRTDLPVGESTFPFIFNFFVNEETEELQSFLYLHKPSLEQLLDYVCYVFLYLVEGEGFLARSLRELCNRQETNGYTK